MEQNRLLYIQFNSIHVYSSGYAQDIYNVNKEAGNNQGVENMVNKSNETIK